ncbi:hypothetical protein HWV23_08865 [Natronomonas halophila]|uniref:DUF7089 family protein n=1 Tax=Natronomonas halophila TaxID=2747817 RepID=UPI0015B4AB38|nr:hypothetical protein [Natronomonas halophila]QLD85830.1 hypothetical protein HWV23_08865 [Natronomonas halophila]
MFDRRELSGDLAEVRDEYAPGALVLDSEGDFETLPPSVAENLLAVVDGIDPLSYPESWVPADAPETLHRIASDEFTVGAPGDGGVAWTRQTDPPTVFVKPRLEGSPEGFIDFLIAEALVEIGTDLPEQFLGFFKDDYAALADAVPLGSADTYQLAAALFDAYVGLHTREEFTAWDGEYDGLHDEWVDAGERLEPRLSVLSSDVASGRTGFPDAAELACAAVKHDVEVPKPFDALDSAAYKEHGAAFAVRWAERTFEALE